MLKRFFVGFVLLLTLTGALFIWQLPRITSLVVPLIVPSIVPLIVTESEGTGLSEIEISLESIRFNQAYLSSIKFRYDGSVIVAGTANGILITWDGLNILKGEISSLVINALDLEFSEDGSIEKNSSSDEQKSQSNIVDTIFMFFSKPLGGVLPFQALVIGELNAYQHAEQGGSKQLVNGSLTLNDENGGISLTSVFRTDAVNETLVELNSSHLGEYFVLVKAANDKELLSFNTSILDQQLHIVGEMNHAIFSHVEIALLEIFENLSVSPISFEGDFVRNVKNTTEAYEVNGDITINISDIKSLRFTASNLSSRFTVNSTEGEAESITIDGEASVGSIQIDEMIFHGLQLIYDLRVQPESDSVFSLGVVLDQASILSGVSANSISIDMSGELIFDDHVAIEISRLEMLVDQPNMPISSGVSVIANSINVALLVNTEQQNIRFQDGWLRSESEITIDAVGLDFGDIADSLDITARLDEFAYPILEQGERFIKGEIFSEQMVLQSQGIPLTFGDVDQDFRLNGDILFVEGTIQDEIRRIGISNDTVFDLASGELESSFEVEKIVIGSADLLANIFSLYNVPLAIVTGQIESSFSLNWNVEQPWSELSINSEVGLTDIGGAYDEYFFSGLNSSFKGAVYPRVESNGQSVLTVDHMDVGLAIKDFKGVMSFEQKLGNDGVELTVFSALGATMGGYIAIRPEVINTANNQHELSMLIIGIDIATLLREQAVEEVIATGTLSGEVPMLINDEGLSVIDGRVYAAEPGGKIQYKGDVEALSVAAGPAGFVFEALQDFNYGSMNIFPEYAPDGTLTMRLEVRGNNPEVEQGRPINFNINLEQNLLKLRESLRYTDGLNEEIDEKVRAFYQDTSGR